jgi:hypothetical protein
MSRSVKDYCFLPFQAFGLYKTFMFRFPIQIVFDNEELASQGWCSQIKIFSHWSKKVKYFLFAHK